MHTMAGFDERVTLGRSGLSVGPLGVAGGYGVGAKALLRAFDRGVNYWYHGSRRAAGMRAAIRELVASGRRDQLVVVLQSYSRWAGLLETMLARGLKQAGLEYADVLLLGWYNHGVGPAVLERCERLREKGMFRQLAVSGHHRPSFVTYAADPRYSVLHLRYNAANSGAERDVFPALPRENRPGIVVYTATRWRKLLDPRCMPPGETPLRAADCYRFVLGNPDVQVCMTGPADDAQMDEALSALAVGPLTADEDRRVRRIGQHVHDHVRWWH
jgi:aryl-alcohol dehydrogenase-like predicted oxidoreductase